MIVLYSRCRVNRSTNLSVVLYYVIFFLASTARLGFRVGAFPTCGAHPHWAAVHSASMVSKLRDSASSPPPSFPPPDFAMSVDLWRGSAATSWTTWRARRWLLGRWTSSYTFACWKSVVLTKAADGEETSWRICSTMLINATGRRWTLGKQMWGCASYVVQKSDVCDRSCRRWQQGRQWEEQRCCHLLSVGEERAVWL